MTELSVSERCHPQIKTVNTRSDDDVIKSTVSLECNKCGYVAEFENELSNPGFCAEAVLLHYWQIHIEEVAAKASPPPEVLQTLAVRWLESFEAAARSQNKPAIMRLFDPSALICGSQKGGPLDQLQSKHFKFEVSSAKMIPHPPCILVVVQWHAVSDVFGGPTRKGDVTLFLGAEMDPEGNRFLCYHAHFSLQ